MHAQARVLSPHPSSHEGSRAGTPHIASSFSGTPQLSRSATPNSGSVAGRPSTRPSTPPLTPAGMPSTSTSEGEDEIDELDELMDDDTVEIGSIPLSDLIRPARTRAPPRLLRKVPRPRGRPTKASTALRLAAAGKDDDAKTPRAGPARLPAAASTAHERVPGKNAVKAGDKKGAGMEDEEDQLQEDAEDQFTSEGGDADGEGDYKKSGASEEGKKVAKGGKTSPDRPRGKFRCPECPMSFTRKTDRTRHSVLHDKAAPVFECQWCAKVLSRGDSLVRHQKKCNGPP
ncbi:hypothetical protein PLICRDRAFT_450779 [Plicaturopsis crispa FD-325 SS-3]|uniref:C2H2-type domain-containing protein n=1 Tax=Plicaturopsis crispa FD-325 SS-3 TaxID=944288 RepID=A0A0C9SK95_PLICR|nr:hypothetical protein PLICRDRAFT_450779 [Plicaturopsis crispa FD-325 SS-3]